MANDSVEQPTDVEQVATRPPLPSCSAAAPLLPRRRPRRATRAPPFRRALTSPRVCSAPRGAPLPPKTTHRRMDSGFLRSKRSAARRAARESRRAPKSVRPCPGSTRPSPPPETRARAALFHPSAGCSLGVKSTGTFGGMAPDAVWQGVEAANELIGVCTSGDSPNTGGGSITLLK